MKGILGVYELCGNSVVIVWLLCGATYYLAPSFSNTWSEISNLLDM